MNCYFICNHRATIRLKMPRTYTETHFSKMHNFSSQRTPLKKIICFPYNTYLLGFRWLLFFTKQTYPLKNASDHAMFLNPLSLALLYKSDICTPFLMIRSPHHHRGSFHFTLKTKPSSCNRKGGHGITKDSQFV